MTPLFSLCWSHFLSSHSLLPPFRSSSDCRRPHSGDATYGDNNHQRLQPFYTTKVKVTLPPSVLSFSFSFFCFFFFYLVLFSFFHHILLLCFNSFLYPFFLFCFDSFFLVPYSVSALFLLFLGWNLLFFYLVLIISIILCEYGCSI